MDRKRRLREEAEQRRRSVSLPSALLFSQAAHSLVDQLGARSIAAYYPFGTEPDMAPFVDQLDRVLIPRLFSADGAPLPGGSWGLHLVGEEWEQPRAAAPRQPRLAVSSEAVSSVDLMLVPALLVDESGVRLGRGGGWYDRVLARLQGSAQVYAVTYSWEVRAAWALPVEPHDIPVHGVLTELGVRELAR